MFGSSKDLGVLPRTRNVFKSCENRLICRVVPCVHGRVVFFFLRRESIFKQLARIRHSDNKATVALQVNAYVPAGDRRA